MKRGDRFLFEGCQQLTHRIYRRQLCRNGIEKMIAKHWQLFECKSPKVKLVHSGELICVGDGKAPVDIRATVEDIQEGSPLKTVKISRPKVIEKDARTLRLF